jgi:hypothetical protein
MKTLLVALGVTLIFSATAAAGTATARSKAHSTDLTLTVSSLGTGTGTITSDPAGIDCPTVCSASFAPGTLVWLHAKPDAGSTADGSSANCPRVYPSGKPPPGLPPGYWASVHCHFVVYADTSVQAIFNLLTTPCLVPLNRGKTVANAEFRLELASCQPVRVSLFHYAFSRTIRKGRVLIQNPRSGTQLKHSATVDLVISKGRRRR